MENEQDAKIAAEIMKSKDWLQVFLLEFFQQWLWPVLIVSEQRSGQFKRDTPHIISLIVRNAYYRLLDINYNNADNLKPNVFHWLHQRSIYTVKQ